MSGTVDEIETELLQLDRSARVALAKALLDSLETLMEAECEELGIEEGEARLADFQTGRTRAVDGDEVFARARAKSL
jgi:hypothetical protein